MTKKIRDEKFEWKPDDVKTTLSQCATCKNNTGVNKCSEYGEKPNEFKFNKRKCPAYLKE